VRLACVLLVGCYAPATLAPGQPVDAAADVDIDGPPPAGFCEDGFDIADGPLDPALWHQLPPGGFAQVASQHATHDASSTAPAHYACQNNPSRPDYVVRADVVFASIDDPAFAAGVLARTNTSGAFYEAIVRAGAANTSPAGQGPITLTIEGSNGSSTVLLCTGGPLQPQPGVGSMHHLELEVAGSQLTARFDGAVVCGTPDSSLDFIGQAGLSIEGKPGVGMGFQLDNFIAFEQ
jgi:hypothetical protein